MARKNYAKVKEDKKKYHRVGYKEKLSSVFNESISELGYKSEALKNVFEISKKSWLYSHNDMIREINGAVDFSLLNEIETKYFKKMMQTSYNQVKKSERTKRPIKCIDEVLSGYWCLKEMACELGRKNEVANQSIEELQPLKEKIEYQIKDKGEVARIKNKPSFLGRIGRYAAGVAATLALLIAPSFISCDRKIEEMANPNSTATAESTKRIESLETQLNDAGEPDDKVRDNERERVEKQYEPKVERLKNENQMLIDGNKTLTQRISDYEATEKAEEEKKAKMQEEGREISKFFSLGNLKFPLSCMTIKKDGSFVMKQLNYVHSDEFRFIDSIDEFNGFASDFAGLYNPAKVDPDALAKLGNLSGVDPNVIKILLEMDSSHNMKRLAQYIMSANPNGIVMAKDGEGNPVIVGPAGKVEEIIKTKTESKEELESLIGGY